MGISNADQADLIFSKECIFRLIRAIRIQMSLNIYLNLKACGVPFADGVGDQVGDFVGHLFVIKIGFCLVEFQHNHSRCKKPLYLRRYPAQRRLYWR